MKYPLSREYVAGAVEVWIEKDEISDLQPQLEAAEKVIENLGWSLEQAREEGLKSLEFYQQYYDQTTDRDELGNVHEFVRKKTGHPVELIQLANRVEEIYL